MKIAIGSDHRGYELKTKIISFLRKKGHKIRDFGTNSDETCDYPPIAYNVARSVSKDGSQRGVLICMTGLGMVMVANKLPSVRAARCDTVEEAKLTRRHNDSNLLVLSARYVKDKPNQILKSWLVTPFEGGRHRRRVRQIKEIEKKIMKEK